jgi:hypothetical protein
VELISFYAKTLEPQIMWFEDDMRYSNHDPVWLGCFCEEHMARFNAALGSNYDRETFIKKITNTGFGPAPLRPAAGTGMGCCFGVR